MERQVETLATPEAASFSAVRNLVLVKRAFVRLKPSPAAAATKDLIIHYCSLESATATAASAKFQKTF